MHGLIMNISDAVITYLIIAIASLVISLVLTYAALRIRVITRDAIIPSVLVGSMILLGGPSSILPFIVFLGSSSALTKIGVEKKEELGTAEDVKGRNWKQVLAVGLVPSTLAMLAGVAYFVRDMTMYQLLSTAAVTSIAYSNADTWASELGVLSKSRPRLITKPWTTVDPGVSGGVTLLGELSSFIGSTTIALTYLGIQYILKLLGYISSVNIWFVVIVLILGYLGEVLDSIFGALFQPKYRCLKCGVMTDREVHVCGERTVRVMGSYDLENEDVNLLVSAIIAAISIITLLLLIGPHVIIPSL
ncbi:DUF92 domain-containing protein [Vulcanisaeta distributa]|uniref:DUF92 domain-containing protein n=1 Tax=Vulcanisaeta distributa (strain DSM 14429 / JCM 11212 / NBRC 100878 / IC-017) TaxID=572478 RepID=E1QNR2_VULDI|nr:DUF92 domain-containing protein [Vulcanisaeta distributa]ADN50158.1 protein of unknown function DUF92 transmembrane [Vulcanisaeta distributa DSM 14429]